jgi:acetylcholinesterase
VKTNSSVLDGFVNSSAPHVRQSLGIPFALPPIGALRWLPPSKLISNTSFAATNMGSACPQLPVTAGASLTASVYSPNGGDQIEFFPQEISSEDCLILNVWTPRGLRRRLPVILWFFGRAFVQGGTSSLYFNPQSWVRRTQEHIVVTVNFRSNVFGFPNSVGLAEQNLGLLDQRLALDWIREKHCQVWWRSIKDC